MTINNILAVVAHPDDLEIMAGGSILRFLQEGKKVHVLVLTTGSWKNPEGVVVRSLEDIQKEVDNVKAYVNYTTYEVLNEETENLKFKDELVCEVLKRIADYKIDTIITTWDHDTANDHKVASAIALAACRRVPNFLMGQINYYMTTFFTPNFYVDITDTWQNKLELISCFTSQWERNCKDWTEFLGSTSEYYGKVAGVKRAEGFIIGKIRY